MVLHATSMVKKISGFGLSNTWKSLHLITVVTCTWHLFFDGPRFFPDCLVQFFPSFSVIQLGSTIGSFWSCMKYNCTNKIVLHMISLLIGKLYNICAPLICSSLFLHRLFLNFNQSDITFKNIKWFGFWQMCVRRRWLLYHTDICSNY